jgi:hypothetical protein
MMPDADAFLGVGWGFPPSFTAGGREVELVGGADDIHQSLQILLATRPGERVMQESFGCDLTGVLFEEIDQRMVNNLTNLVREAILYHETRIRLDALDVVPDAADAGLLRITLEYTVLASNSRFNMVYPFYINEAAST